MGVGTGRERGVDGGRGVERGAGSRNALAMGVARSGVPPNGVLGLATGGWEPSPLLDPSSGSFPLTLPPVS